MVNCQMVNLMVNVMNVKKTIDLGISYLAMGQNLVPLVNIKIAGIYGSVNYPLTLIIIGFDTDPYQFLLEDTRG